MRGLANTEGITISMQKMKRVIECHPEDMDVVVQPGITYAELNEFLEPQGFFFPLDPGPGASVGGMLGTSCSGTNAVRYGTAKDQVLSMKVVMPDGVIVKTGTRAKKSSAGYDLTHLFIGSEGTLGITGEAILKVYKIPEFKSAALCHYDNIRDAANTVIRMMQAGIRIGKVEMLDEECIRAVNLSGGHDYKEKVTLIFEFSGMKSEVDDQVARTKQIAAEHTPHEFVWASSQDVCTFKDRDSHQGKRRTLESTKGGTMVCSCLATRRKSTHYGCMRTH